MEIDSSSQPTSAPVPCPPLNGLHRPILGEGDGSRLREMLEGVDTTLKRSLPLDFMSSNPETFLEAPVAVKRPRMDEEELLTAADRNVTTITDLVTLNRCIETSGALHHDGSSSAQRQRDERVNHCNDLNSAPIFRSVLFGETSTKFQHFTDSAAISSSHAVPPPDTNLKHHEVSKSLTFVHCPGEVTHDQSSAPANPNPVMISCSDPFHDLTGDVSLQVCTSLDEIPPTHHDTQDAVGRGEEEEQPKNEEQTRERRQSARMAAVKLSKKEMQAVRKKIREEEKEEKRRKREEQQEKKRLKALEMAEKKRLREEQKIRKAAEMEEKKRKRAIEMEERRKKKEAEEEQKKRRKEELQERLRQREEERRQQQEAKARREEENKKLKAPVKKRKKQNELVADEVEEGEDGWKKNAGLTMEDREKIPLGPMSGVERVFSWLFGKHSDTADLPPYLHMNEELNRILPQLQVATVTESHDAQKE